MRIVSASEVDDALGYADLVEALREAFRRDTTVPLRHHHTIPTGGREATLLLMPAWNAPDPAPAHVGVKIVTVYPDNTTRDLPAVMGTYLLLDGQTGEPAVSIDGPALTARRTAAASALAADYLARPDAQNLLMVGTGRLAGNLIDAHAAVRPIRHRNGEGQRATVRGAASDGDAGSASVPLAHRDPGSRGQDHP